MKFSLLTTAAVLGTVGAFSVSSNKGTSVVADADVSRRSFFGGVAAAFVATGATLATTEPASAAPLGKVSVVQSEINSFNALINEFKDTTLNGLDASKLNEPSVSFIQFGQAMKDGQVEFVEFMAPEGDVAYATFKASDKKAKKGEENLPEGRVRIGEGYPITSKKSWSSPAYVIRSVSNYGVPYKFTVPALAKFQK